MKITVAKFGLYPVEEPTGYAVGFTVEANNGRSFYTDTVVPLTEATGKTDDEIISMGFQDLKDQITFRVGALEQRSPLLGQGWTPPDNREPDDPEQPIVEDLDMVKAQATRQLELKTQRFIENLSNGNDRYKWFQGISLLNMKMSLSMVPEEFRTPEMINILSRILEVELWQQSVYVYFYEQAQLLMIAEEPSEVYALVEGFDLQPFDATDPDMSLAELFIFI